MVCFVKCGEYVLSCLRLVALLNRADCVFTLLWEQGSSLYLDTTSVKAYFVLEAGEILVCCVHYLRFLPHRGPAVVKGHSSTGHKSPGVSILPGSIIPCQGRNTALLVFSCESEEKQKGLSPWYTVESLWNVSSPCRLHLLSFQLPWTLFWLLATFPAQQKLGYLSDLSESGM